MSNAVSSGSSGGVGGAALSLMGCVREASPPPAEQLPVGMADQQSIDAFPKGARENIFLFDLYILDYLYEAICA